MYDNLNVSMELKNRTEQDNIYETLQHGTRELADKTTPSAKKCTPFLLWCILVVNSILIGLLIIAVSVCLYMCINVSKASNSKESMKNMTEVVGDIIKDVEESTSGLDNFKMVTDEINKKCEDGLSDLSKNLERKTNDLRSSSTESIKNVSEVVANIKKDVEKSTSGLDDLKAVTDDIKEQMKELDQATEKKTQSMESMAVIVENIKKDLEESSSGLDDLKTVTGEVKGTCKDGLLDLSNKFAALEKQIKELDQATEKKTQTVAFNVMDVVSYSGTDAIKFSNILLNEGDAYDNNTGIFTAPTDGIYQFNAHICGKREKEIEYYIKAGPRSIATGEFIVPDTATDTKCTSFSAVALVRKGENVRVGGMSYSSLDREDNDLSSFSGILIRAA